MSIMHREIELTVRIGNQPTEMGAVGIIAWHTDVEVLATRSYWDRDGGVMLLVTTNPTKAFHILEAAGFKCHTHPAILVGPLHRSGLAALIGKELAASGIDVLCSYASQIEVGHHYLVFKTTEDDRAMEVLEGSANIRDETEAKSWQDQNAVSEIGLNWQQAAA